MIISLSEINKIKYSLNKNRSEHLGNDVWSDFVLPRFFNNIDLVSDMPTRLEGGRGSGKTMLLRYLSYHSQFSRNRDQIPNDTVSRIGLYWKADTQFLRMMQRRGINQDDWSLVFDHYLTLKLSFEVVSSIIAISKSNYEALEESEVEIINIEGIKDFGFVSEKFTDVTKEISSLIRKTEMEIQNAKGVDELIKLPPSFISFLLDALKSKIKCLGDTTFSVYIDEYENLLSYQQQVINTKIKHSEPPLIFNIAIKLNGMSDPSTLSDEKLQNIADYTIINLDEEIERSGFDTYVSEILLKKLGDASPSIRQKLDIDLSICSREEYIEKRKSREYIDHCKVLVESIFPGRSHMDLADEIFSTQRYRKKLYAEIETALKIRGEKSFVPDDFINEDFKKASIVCTSLLFRKSLPIKEVSVEFNNLANGYDNKFTNKTAWEHNNFIGCYLRLIRAYKANSTFYSGFDIYSALSGGNVRHFLELCKTAINLVDENDFSNNMTVDRKVQHMAARLTSEELLKEIEIFTPIGIQLSNFVKGMGRVFQLCQDKEAQSEPEVTHFGIKDDELNLDDEGINFFREAEKWGVLKKSESTKSKSMISTDVYDYILNPIYAPFFFISYRKGRKLEIEYSDLVSLYKQGTSAVTLQLKKKLKLSEVGDEVESHEQGSLL